MIAGLFYAVGFVLAFGIPLGFLIYGIWRLVGGVKRRHDRPSEGAGWYRRRDWP